MGWGGWHFALAGKGGKRQDGNRWPPGRADASNEEKHTGNNITEIEH